MGTTNLAIRIAQAEKHLASIDKRLGKLIERQKPIVHSPRDNYFFSLCRSIVGQQISVAAASTIFERLNMVTDLKPSRVLDLDEVQAKKIGLSKQKFTYLHDLAQHFVTNPAVYDHLDKLSDEDVIADLTAVKGIGTWTAQMFLMFTLSRLDVFAPDDVGLQRAMTRLYGWSTLPPKRELETFAERWRPYRSVASWHLWKSLQNTPN